MTRHLTVAVERFPIAGAFTISRGSRTEAAVVVARLSDEAGLRGQGECVPYARYGESVESVAALIAAQEEAVAGGLTRAELLERLPAGAARNALDCALLDLEAKQLGRPVKWTDDRTGSFLSDQHGRDHDHGHRHGHGHGHGERRPGFLGSAPGAGQCGLFLWWVQVEEGLPEQREGQRQGL